MEDKSNQPVYVQISISNKMKEIKPSMVVEGTPGVSKSEKGCP